MSAIHTTESVSSADHFHHRERILANRFRTKLCDKFEENGWCPYETRCMFAHGEENLRSTEQNLEDGLTTEDAIRAFKARELQLASRKKSRSGRKKRANRSRAGKRSLAADSPAPAQTADSDEEVESEVHNSSGSRTPVRIASRQDCYRHNPYGFAAVDCRYMTHTGAWYNSEDEEQDYVPHSFGTSVRSEHDAVPCLVSG